MRRSIAAITIILTLALALAAQTVASGERERVEVPVIMYHHILKDPARWNDYVISPETLEGDLQYLRARGYESVTTSELIDWCEGRGQLPEKPVLITFDDGQESFAVYALPLLEKYGMTAVVAIVGSYADRYTECPDHNINYSCLSWPAVAELGASPYAELAGHSYDMHALSPRRGCRSMAGETRESYEAALGADLERLESRFTEYCGDVPLVFAYPFGAYCAQSREILAQRGYKVLLTCDERVNLLTGNEADLMSLGRFNRASRYDRAAFFARLGIE